MGLMALLSTQPQIPDTEQIQQMECSELLEGARRMEEQFQRTGSSEVRRCARRMEKELKQRRDDFEDPETVAHIRSMQEYRDITAFLEERER